MREAGFEPACVMAPDSDSYHELFGVLVVKHDIIPCSPLPNGAVSSKLHHSRNSNAALHRQEKARTMLLLFVSIFMPRLLAVRCKRIVRHRLIYYCRIWFRNMSNFPTLRTMPHAEPVYFTRYTLEPFPISHDNWHIRCFYFNVSHWLQCANFARSFLCNSAERANSGASKGRGHIP